MSDSDKPVWPPAAFPFMPFSMPGTPARPAAATATPGLAGGIDAMKSFWGSLPGSSHVPGFLVPTLDIDELDRRIADLRAAESWVEVNLNLLRGTIQGLEVQRHTIAALQSMTAPGGAPPLAGGAAFDWAKAVVPDRKTPAPTPKAPEPAAPVDSRAATAPTPAGTAAAALPGLDAATWLGYLQDQFAKVAEAALAGAKTAGRTATGASATANAAGRGAASGKVAKKAAAARRRTSGSGSRKSKPPD